MESILIVTHIFTKSGFYRNLGHRQSSLTSFTVLQERNSRKQQRKPPWDRNRIKVCFSDKPSLNWRTHASVAFIVLGGKKLQQAHEQELPVSSQSLNHVTVSGEPEALLPWHRIVLITVYLYSASHFKTHRYFSEQLVRRVSLMVPTSRMSIHHTP